VSSSDQELVLMAVARDLIANAIEDITWGQMAEFDDRLDDVDLSILDKLLDEAKISWE
jgi:hypothetical protein